MSIPSGANLKRLISILSQSKIQSTNPSLYQVIFQLINAAQQQLGILQDEINKLEEAITNITNNITSISISPGDIAANSLEDAFNPVIDITPLEQFTTLVNNLPIMPASSVTPPTVAATSTNGLLNALDYECDACNSCMPFVGNIIS